MSEQAYSEHSKVFVGNLPFKATNADLEALFRPFGDIVGVSIRKDRVTNKPKGFAFVSFSRPESGPNAIQSLNGQSYQGRPLTVSAAEKRGTKGGDGDEEGEEGGGNEGATTNKDTSWKTVPTLSPSAAAAAASGSGGGGRRPQGVKEGAATAKSWGSWAGPPTTAKSGSKEGKK